MTRTGKIARLPLAIRNQLGQRLRDAEPGKNLVDWLNTLPEVKAVLTESFSDRPITEQNLSEWKQGGGYDEWLRHQEALEWAHVMREQVTELTQTTGGAMSLSESASTLLAVALGRWLHESMAKPQPTEKAEDRRELLALAHELNRLRREEQRAAMVKLQQAKRADVLRKEEERRADMLRREEEQRIYVADRERRYATEAETSWNNMRHRVVREILQRVRPQDHEIIEGPAYAFGPPSSPKSNSPRSDQIRPNPTSSPS